MVFKRFFLILIPLALLFSCTPTDRFTLVLQNKTNRPNHEPLYLNELSGAIERVQLIAINDNAQSSFKGETVGTVGFNVTFEDVDYAGTTPIALELNESYLLTFRYSDVDAIPLKCQFSLSDGTDQFIDLAIVP